MANRLELILGNVVRRIKHGRIEPYAHDRGEELKVDLQRLEVFEDPLSEFDLTYDDALLNIELRHALHHEFEEPEPPNGLWDKMKRTMETTIKGDPERDMTAMPDVHVQRRLPADRVLVAVLVADGFRHEPHGARRCRAVTARGNTKSRTRAGAIAGPLPFNWAG
jgi:hypothetical protein